MNNDLVPVVKSHFSQNCLIYYVIYHLRILCVLMNISYNTTTVCNRWVVLESHVINLHCGWGFNLILQLCCIIAYTLFGLNCTEDALSWLSQCVKMLLVLYIIKFVGNLYKLFHIKHNISLNHNLEKQNFNYHILFSC